MKKLLILFTFIFLYVNVNAQLNICKESINDLIKYVNTYDMDHDSMKCTYRVNYILEGNNISAHKFTDKINLVLEHALFCPQVFLYSEIQRTDNEWSYNVFSFLYRDEDTYKTHALKIITQLQPSEENFRKDVEIITYVVK